jgi:hypothetical protein
LLLRWPATRSAPAVPRDSGGTYHLPRWVTLGTRLDPSCDAVRTPEWRSAQLCARAHAPWLRENTPHIVALGPLRKPEAFAIAEMARQGRCFQFGTP